MILKLVNPPEVPGFSSDRDKAGGLGTMIPIRKLGKLKSLLPNLPPLDLLYAAALAEREGVRVEIVEALGEKLDKQGVIQRLNEPSNGIDFIGVRLSLPSLREDLELAALIRENFSCRVFLFGNAIRSTEQDWPKLFPLPEGIEVLRGEIEALMIPYLQNEALPEEWALVEELDLLPFPAWHLVALQDYAPQGRIKNGVFNLSTSRGCPKGCPMCPYFHTQGKKWRFQSPERVIAEIDWLHQLGMRVLQTRDPNLGLNRGRLEAIAEMLSARPYRMRIAAETDLESLDRPLLGKLEKAGFFRILTGLESGDPACLKDIEQDRKALERSLENADFCREIGIEVVGFFLFGSPSESFESIESTTKLAKKLPIRTSTSLMTPYPGTRVREEIEREKRFYAPNDYHQYGGMGCLIRTRNLSRQELSLAYRWAEEELQISSRSKGLSNKTGWPFLRGSLGLFLISLQHLPLTWRFQEAKKRTKTVETFATMEARET